MFKYNEILGWDSRLLGSPYFNTVANLRSGGVFFLTERGMNAGYTVA